MPRGNPEPWFRPSRRTYYVTVNGVQHNLHTADKAEAYRRWHELMVRAPEPPESPDATVVVILAAFLDWEEKHTKKSTYEWHRHYLQGFVASLQDKQLLVSESEEVPRHPLARCPNDLGCQQPPGGHHLAQTGV